MSQEAKRNNPTPDAEEKDAKKQRIEEKEEEAKPVLATPESICVFSSFEDSNPTLIWNQKGEMSPATRKMIELLVNNNELEDMMTYLFNAFHDLIEQPLPVVLIDLCDNEDLGKLFSQREYEEISENKSQWEKISYKDYVERTNYCTLPVRTIFLGVEFNNDK